ncbi:FISUMP domain-containing protein [Fibrella aquatilis]|uniref:Fibrobacter succinogenes major paralogous domain-containing protein n=1 Tax=Fibrella aquatilis TaxID=2817059 RepID=A0A939G526_9BACT|nr:FISUMP domain-containing protein [Fibrella aquatilis]MBO0932517.1 hypothetical protein [Fibrella aquatilis]
MKSLRIYFILSYFILLLAAATSCRKDPANQPLPQPASVVIADKTYPIIAIGNQVWTAANYAGPGGVGYRSGSEKPEYGRYYTFIEAKAVPLPSGWRLPTTADYLALAQQQGVVVTNFEAKGQQAIRNLMSTSHWRTLAGTNTSGFNAYPAGYVSGTIQPQDGDLAEFWTMEGNTLSIQENAAGNTHILRFYQNSNSPDDRFNLRFVRDK